MAVPWSGTGLHANVLPTIRLALTEGQPNENVRAMTPLVAERRRFAPLPGPPNPALACSRSMRGDHLTLNPRPTRASPHIRPPPVGDRVLPPVDVHVVRPPHSTGEPSRYDLPSSPLSHICRASQVLSDIDETFIPTCGQLCGQAWMMGKPSRPGLRDPHRPPGAHRVRCCDHQVASRSRGPG